MTFRVSRNLEIAASVLLALLICCRLGAEEPPTVPGTVTDEARRPLAHVNWRISGIEEWHDGKWQLVFRDGLTREYATGNDGRFEVTFSEKVRYDLQFDKWGYAPVFLYQVSADSAEIHVVMRKGMSVHGTVSRLGKEERWFGGTVVELRLPNPRGFWYEKSVPLGVDGKFEFHVSPPPLPPMVSGLEETPKWQVVCVGEVVELDVIEGKPVDEVHFVIDVKVSRRPAQQTG
jgi:hypothetical protein